MTIDFKTPQDDNIPSIHDQIKNKVLFSKEHWTIKSLLEASGINYRSYYTYTTSKKPSIKILKQLVDMGIILNDDTLIYIYPKM